MSRRPPPHPALTQWSRVTLLPRYGGWWMKRLENFARKMLRNSERSGPMRFSSSWHMRDAENWVDLVKGRVKRKRHRGWGGFSRRYRQWRTEASWPASIEHPVEAWVSERLRSELRTEDMLHKVNKELASHERAAAERATWILSIVVFAMTIIPTIEAIRRLF